MQYMVDTCIINKLLDGKMSLNSLPKDSSFFATHIQHDEINKTPDIQRKNQLLHKFQEIAPNIIATESAVWDVSSWDMANWSDGDLYNQLKTALDSLNKAKKNNNKDVLIAETAIKNNYTLLTSDNALAEVAKKFGCSVQFFKCN